MRRGRRRVIWRRVCLLAGICLLGLFLLTRLFCQARMPADIPQALLQAAQENEELEAFARGYPDGKENDFQGIPQEYREGEVPLYLQWDARWGYTWYGDTYLGLSGCAPTVVSMAASYLLNDGTLTPNAIARYAQHRGDYVEGVGSSWSLIEEGMAQLGIEVHPGVNEEEEMAQVIMQGGLILCSVGPGDFTKSGHFILLCGYDPARGFLVHDPNSAERTEQTWDLQTVLRQCRNIWAFSAA